MLEHETKNTATVILLQRQPGGDTCEVRSIHPSSVRRGVARMLPDGEYHELAATFQALADPSRLKIVYSLFHQELCTCDLAAIVDISESAASQHLKLLRQLRLVKSRREGKVVYYSLDDDHIGKLLAICLAHVRDQQAEQTEQ